MQDFSTYDNTIDGVNSGLIKQNEIFVVSTQETECAFGITIIQLARPDVNLFDPDEAGKLPASLLLASRNLLSSAQVSSAQKAVGNRLPCFFYGAQMYPAVLRDSLKSAIPLEVILDMTPATVDDLERCSVADRSWPAVRPKPGAQVTGLLALSIPQTEQTYLDRFRGDTSIRTIMQARIDLDDQRTAQVNCYVYTTSDTSKLDVLSSDAKRWRVSELMQDEWHRQNLTYSAVDEAALMSEL